MSEKQLSDGNPTGTNLGQNTSDLIGFHGVTNISQRAAAVLTATSSLFGITGTSFVAQSAATLSGVYAFNSGTASDLIDAIQEIRAALVAYGLHKGGA